MAYKSYSEMKAEHQKRINEFPLGFAFGNKQFNEMMEKWNLDPEKDLDKIYSIGAGGYIRRTDSEAFTNLIKLNENEEKEFKRQSKHLKDMFLYELGNHEYCITHTLGETLDACNISEEEFMSSEQMQKAMKAAIKEYNKTNK